ncbi:68cc2447-9ccf-4604-b0ca-cadc1b23d248 [Thermothielavioides terrestris]|uniref:68cc2447-9ccf-4604-b0ca-cadc1b23d248 n=1 Tax=Thermothielavioides terrestris TaxID=2587410 RepID=A0A446BPI9_9PEZI|nr:68cc2447-9ccf-4604-b0ca-cadc1b23d248 [Thermothielavioides terrestris]
MPRVHSSVRRRRKAARFAAAKGGKTANANLNVHNISEHIADNVAGSESVVADGRVDNPDDNARSSSTNLDELKATIQALAAGQLQIVRSIQRLVEVLERQWMFSELYKERDGFMKKGEDVHKKIEDLDRQVRIMRDLMISREAGKLTSAEFADLLRYLHFH